MRKWLRHLPVKGCTEMVKIEKGWSRDEKYVLWTSQGIRYLLRVSDIREREAKEREFKAMEKMAGLGIPMSKPLWMKALPEDGKVLMLLSWIEGDTLEDVIQEHDPIEQYRFGVEAGKILARIHSTAAPEGISDWETRMRGKIGWHLAKYKECGIRVEGDEAIQSFIESHMHLLENRTQSMQHGDYHIGNMVLKPDKTLGIIDFNRWDHGDPYEEFYKMVFFSRKKSIPFCKGQLKGYFGEGIPPDFHGLLALYIADVALFSVVWAMPYGQKEVDTMKDIAAMVYRDYAGFTKTVPGWMEGTGKEEK
ncbi:MAG: phosphotransferase [Clostridia bacterium]